MLKNPKKRHNLLPWKQQKTQEPWEACCVFCGWIGIWERKARSSIDEEGFASLACSEEVVGLLYLGEGEAIINAFVQNRLTDLNSPMFCAYSDRVEILSHGALPPKQTVKGFFEGVSVPVNPELSTIFLQLHLSERTGRGVPKIINAYDRGIFEFGANTISVILPYDRLEVEAQTPQVNTPIDTPVAPVDTPVNTPVDTLVDAQGEKQERILLFCSEPRGILEIAEHLKYKQKKSVRSLLIPLIEQGRLAMTIPQSQNSRFQKNITIK